MHYNYIAIEGNIGAGKTSLAQHLADDLNTRLILEQFEENSFLPKFYKDPAKYAFPLELSFLAERYQQLKDELSKTDLFKPTIIADYFINKSLIFARKNLQEDEYALYRKMFNIILPSLPRPDLLIYLYRPIDQLKQNIQKRGRSYEQEIVSAYLERIQESYFETFRQLPDYRIVVVDTSNLDFVNCSKDYQKLLNLINQEFPIGLIRVEL